MTKIVLQRSTRCCYNVFLLFRSCSIALMIGSGIIFTGPSKHCCFYDSNKDCSNSFMLVVHGFHINPVSTIPTSISSRSSSSSRVAKVQIGRTNQYKPYTNQYKPSSSKVVVRQQPPILFIGISSSTSSDEKKITNKPIAATTTTTTTTTKRMITVANTFGRPLKDGTKEQNQFIIHTIKGFLFDTLFQGKEMERMYARFYALETIARMPYFSYLSVLHLFETLGLWRQADALKIHFSESWNELHHLLIMEELGGNQSWNDRFIAQHIAFFYYWIVVTIYLYNPVLAYNLNEAVEEEAYQTYDSFIQKYHNELKQLPAPAIAIEYYSGNDLYLFDSMHHATTTTTTATSTSTSAKSTVYQQQNPEDIHRRRPVIQNLYDVFVAVRDDEMEHVKTMAHFQQ